MQYSLVKQVTDTQKADAKGWLMNLLANEHLGGFYMPASLGTLIIYKGNEARILQRGNWQESGQIIYLASGANNEAGLGIHSKLAVLACVASTLGLTGDIELINAFADRLARIIQSMTRTVYAGIISAVDKPARLAIDLGSARVAAELEGRWYLPGGAPAEVDDSWVTMDFLQS